MILPCRLSRPFSIDCGRPGVSAKKGGEHTQQPGRRYPLETGTLFICSGVSVLQPRELTRPLGYLPQGNKLYRTLITCRTSIRFDVKKSTGIRPRSLCPAFFLSTADEKRFFYFCPYLPACLTGGSATGGGFRPRGVAGSRTQGVCASLGKEIW